MTEELNNKLAALAGNENVLVELQNVTSIEEFKSALANNNVDLSDEDIQELLAQAETSEDGELSDEALENVSGGSIRSIINRIIQILPKIPRLPISPGPILPIGRQPKKRI